MDAKWRFEDSAAPIHDWDGKITGSVIVFHDITASQAMAMKMRHALERQEFVMHYQCKVNLDTGMITGAEALLRWICVDRIKTPKLPKITRGGVYVS